MERGGDFPLLVYFTLAVPVSGVENANYYYSTYNVEDKSSATANPKKIMILGGGSNRIGQGIEFDYCCCHAAMQLKEMVYETINFDEAKACADKIGYPIMIRPSFVLGGRGMEVIYDENTLREYVEKAVGVTPDRPLLIDRFLKNALECEADALADSTHVYIPAVMEHVELAGIHSGDSACVIPPVSIPPRLQHERIYTRNSV